MNDKRRNSRFQYSSIVDIEIEEGAIIAGNLVNLSTGGALVMSDPQPTYGDKVKLHIQLPGVPDRSEISCIVRWIIQGEGAGYQFERLRPIETWAISRLKRELEDS